MLLTGSPGGRTIINTVFTIVLGVTEYGLTGRQAVDLARIHHQWLPDRVTFEEGAVPEETLAALRAMGHDVRAQGRQGDAHSIWVAPDGTPYGVTGQAHARLEGVGCARFDSTLGGTVGCRSMFGQHHHRHHHGHRNGGPVEFCAT